MRRLRELQALFDHSGTIVVPPGEYRVAEDGGPIRLQSNQRILAHGARFLFPERLGDRARLIAFEGVDVGNVTWEGGFFAGRCFDPSAGSNSWEPNVNTRGIVFGGRESACRDITVSAVSGAEVAGAVISVYGQHAPGSTRKVSAFAENITVSDCTLTNCGKFMWDYGYLWQILGWPEDYGSRELALAGRYFPAELLQENVRVEPSERLIRVDDPTEWEDVCFFGPAVPSVESTRSGPAGRGASIVRGRRYFIAERGADWIRVSETPGGRPLDLDGLSAGGVTVVHDLHRAYMELYAPAGSGPGKGAVDLTACRATMMSGNRLSARGDTMHIHSCHNNVFANNQILGSRMGAFFLAEWCKNSTITGNTVDGSNGSRVASVEKSNEDVTLIGNTFRNGGRGSWINQPANIVIKGNVFINNTTKCEDDPRRGRRTFDTGGYERRAELYFTTHEPGGRYGPAIVHDNVFVTGPEAEAAIELHAGGHDISIRGNLFTGVSNAVVRRPGCERIDVDQNINLIEK